MFSTRSLYSEDSCFVMSEESIQDLNQKLDKFIDTVDNRFRNIESLIRDPRRAQERLIEEGIPPNSARHEATGNPPLDLPGAVGPSTTSDLQGEFQSLRDSLNRVRIPAELKLSDSRQGIEGQTTFC